MADAQLLNRSSLEEDKEALAEADPANEWHLYTLIKLNVVTKMIYWRHVKILNTLLHILTRLKELQLDDTFSDVAFARVTHEAILGLEDSDSDSEQFFRRMGLRHYLKQLKANMLKVSASKQAKEASKLRKA